jgi:hypothetical protein
VKEHIRLCKRVQIDKTVGMRSLRGGRRLDDRRPSVDDFSVFPFGKTYLFDFARPFILPIVALDPKLSEYASAYALRAGISRPYSRSEGRT